MTLLGLCFLPAAFADHSDVNTLEMGVSLFSAGLLIAALGTYFKMRALKSGILAGTARLEATPKRKAREACDLCGTEMPVVLCTVHQVHVCADCLTQHYDRRSCAYVPSKRSNGSSRPARVQVKATGA
jgi:hypothetical protein